MCNLNAGYNRKRCKTVGGVKRIYLSDFTDFQTFTRGELFSDRITKIDGVYSRYFEIQQTVQDAQYSETAVQSTENFTEFIEQTLTFRIFLKNTAAKDLVNEITKGCFRVIIEDNNGILHLMGEKTEAYCTEATGNIGKSWSDSNSYNITIKAMTYDTSSEILESAFDDLRVFADLTTNTKGIRTLDVEDFGSNMATGTYTNVSVSTVKGAKFMITVNNGSMVAYTVTSPGNDYDINEIVFLAPNSIPPLGNISQLNPGTLHQGWYVAGTHTNVPLLGGTGTGALATIVIDPLQFVGGNWIGGNIVSVTVTNPGVGYSAGDVLSIDGSGTTNVFYHSSELDNTYIVSVAPAQQPNFKVRSTIWI